MLAIDLFMIKVSSKDEIQRQNSPVGALAPPAGGSRTAFLGGGGGGGLKNSSRYQDFDEPSSNLGSYASLISSKFPIKATVWLNFVENSATPVS